MIRTRVLALLAVVLCGLGWAHAETPGKDGAKTVSASGEVVNLYTLLTSGGSSGSTSITVASAAGITAGDVILIYQANGATISQVDSAAYGAVTSLGNAGRYEFQTVASVAGSVITLQTYGSACGGLVYNYTSGRAQVIRVPQYSTLTVNSGASIAAAKWNGSTGGVVALRVQGAATINGTVTADAMGFRGGAIENVTQPAGSNITIYRSTNAADGAEKGESIAGFQTDYTLGRYGRGAPANGGGGGNAHNAGGGGGANGANGFTWSGMGVPDTSNSNWVQAWNIDGTLNASTNSSGGGRGGYTYGRGGPDPRVTGPGVSSWGGNSRRELGGLGGRPLSYVAAGRVYFGGGGGAGDGNNSAAGKGGDGGGLIIIAAGSISGGGTISANGQAGANTTPRHNDAPGGGGGGGTIMLKALSVGGVTLRANGGAGGNQLITNDENEGPGGGGGGGVIAIENGATTRTATGGANGTTSANSMTLFIPNGATRGATGLPNASAPSDAAFPYCRFRRGAVLEATKAVEVYLTTNAEGYAVPGQDVIYSLSVTNTGTGPADSGSITLIDRVPDEVTVFTGTTPEFGGARAGWTPGTSGLSFNAVTDFAFSNAATAPTSFAGCTYTPVAPYDPAITYVCFRPQGAMTDADPDPQFTIRFRARVE